MAMLYFLIIPAIANFDNENNHIILISLTIIMLFISYNLIKDFIKYWKHRKNAETFESVDDVTNFVEYTTLNDKQEQVFFNQLYTVYIDDISPNTPVTYYYPQEEENIIEKENIAEENNDDNDKKGEIKK